MRILPCGDRAVLVELVEPRDVPGLHESLRAARSGPLAGVVDVVPGERTILLRTAPGADLAAIAAAIATIAPRPATGKPARVVDIPTRYDGPDLAGLAAELQVDREALVAAHTGAVWQVAFCGFTPGFGYLRSDSWQCRVARRPDPRRRVPSGAVALAGPYSGIYPHESPGGWQLIGSTDVVLWDSGRATPALLTPGTTVRFVALPWAAASS